MFKDLLVNLDASEQGERRLAAALSLAANFDAHLSGLYVVPPDPVPMLYTAGAPAGAVLRSELEPPGANPLRDQAKARQSAFESACQRAGVADASWLYSEGPVASVVSTYARFTDLVIVGQDSPEPTAANTPPGVAADVALESGRPTLIVPHAGDWEHIGTRVMIAWTPTRESSRALHDALPLLAQARTVTVFTVVVDSAHQAPDPAPGLDIEAHLRRHGIQTTWQRDVSDLEVGDELLSRLADRSCDLLVMGAYGHSRLRELVFGGTTRHLLAHMTAPVLLSN